MATSLRWHWQRQAQRLARLGWNSSLDSDGTAYRTDDGSVDFDGTADANLEGSLDFDGTEDSMDDGSLDSDGIDEGTWHPWRIA